MAKCDACNSTILMGGKTEGNLRFCNDKCWNNGIIARGAQDLPVNLVEDEVRAIHSGSCPKCSGPGPVDLHTYHQIWSALYLTSQKSVPQLSCRDCGRKKQIFSAILSFFLGWWGFPWGILGTPVQIYRNIKGILKPPDPAVPSDALRAMVKLNIARRMIAQGAAPTPPIASPLGGTAPPPAPIAKATAPPTNPFSNQDAFKS